MPIEVRFYSNLFWAEGNVKPNRMPAPDRSDVLPRQPRMYDFSTGYIKLYGVWNYAIFEGRHYFLDIVKRFDEEKKSYGYGMRLDYWIEALKRKPTIKGTLSTSNNDELLEKHLQYTYPTLFQPANSKRINFKENVVKWYDKVEIVKSENKLLHDVVVSKEGWDIFIQSYKRYYVREYEKDWSKNFFNDPGVDAIYIFSALRKDRSSKTWKSELIRKLNNFLDDIKKNGENYKIAKCTSPAGSALLGKYCITTKQEGIGGGDENIEIEKIDLSGIQDIKEIRSQDLSDYLWEEVPSYVLTKFDLESAIFRSEIIQDQIEDSIEENTFGFKICRKFYGSFIGRESSSPLRGTALGSWQISDKYNAFDEDWKKYTWCDFFPGPVWIGRKCEDTYDRFLPLFFNWGNGDTVQSLKFKTEIAGVPGYVSHGITYWVDRINFTISSYRDSLLDTLRNNQEGSLSFPSPRYVNDKDYISDEYFRTMKNAPGYGFLIFQTIRSWSSWNTIEYTGDTPISRLDVIVGFNNYFNFHAPGWLTLDKQRFPRLIENSNGLVGNIGVLLFKLDLYSFLHFASTSMYYDYAYATENSAVAFQLEGNLTSSPSWYSILDAKKDIKGHSNLYNTEDTTLVNPFTDDRYGAHALRREKLLRAVTITDFLNLPWKEGLKKGDYFFTDLEYAISQIRNRNPRNVHDRWMSFGNSGDFDPYSKHDTSVNRRSIGVLSDFVRRPEEENSQRYFNRLENTVVLCSTKEKKFEFRTFEYFTKRHELSSASNQILYSVNGNVDQTIRYCRLKKLGIEVDTSKLIIPEDVQLKILKAFYEANGYKFKSGYWNWVTIESLENEVSDRIFDLVGTGWYCHLKKGKVSLIWANKKGDTVFSNPFKESVEKLQVLDVKDSFKNLTLLEKINQKCFLNIHTEIRPLKTRFTFSEDSRLNIFLKAAKPNTFLTGNNYYTLQVKDKFDVIDREILAIPKMPTDSVDIATASLLEQQRLSSLRAKQDYEIAQGRFETRENWINEMQKRRTWEANFHHKRAQLNIWTGAFGSVPYRAESFYNARRQNLFNQAEASDYYGVPVMDFSVSQFMGISAGSHVVGKGLGLVSSIAGAIGNSVLAGMEHRESLRKADYDKQHFLELLQANKMQSMFEHERAKEDSMLQINSLSNVYRKGMINDAHLVDELNKDKSLNDGLELNPIHLAVFTPSSEQLKYLVDHKERHGVDCYIPNQTYEFFFGMKPDVIRFKDLYSEEIKELELHPIRQVFLAMIYAGIKIVNVDEKIAIELSESEVLSGRLALEQDANKRLEGQNLQLTTKNEELGVKITDLENAKEGLEKVKSELTAKADKLTEEITQINAEIQKKQAEVTKLETDLKSATTRADTLSASVHRLEGELTQTTNVKNLLQAEVNQMRPKVQELTTVKNENTRLTNQIIDLGTKVHNLTNQIAALTDQKITWTYQGDPETGNVTLNQSLSNLNNQLEALGKYSEAIKGDKAKKAGEICLADEHEEKCLGALCRSVGLLVSSALEAETFIFWSRAMGIYSLIGQRLSPSITYDNGSKIQKGSNSNRFFENFVSWPREIFLKKDFFLNSKFAPHNKKITELYNKLSDPKFDFATKVTQIADMPNNLYPSIPKHLSIWRSEFWTGTYPLLKLCDDILVAVKELIFEIKEPSTKQELIEARKYLAGANHSTWDGMCFGGIIAFNGAYLKSTIYRKTYNYYTSTYWVRNPKWHE